MYGKFLQLEPEKQIRVINAAIKVFAHKRYKDAGTDDIVREAGISKGSLFHYFRNKKDLYQYLQKYTFNILMDEFYGVIDLNERDFLQRWKQVFSVKFMMLNKYPDMFNFIKNVYMETDSDLKNEIEFKSQDLLMEAYAKLLKDIDTSLFREDIDLNHALNIIIWTLESFSQKQQTLLGFENIDSAYFHKVTLELECYIELFKKCFYKENLSHECH